MFEPREPLFKVKNFDLEESMFSDSMFKVQIGDASSSCVQLFVRIPNF